MQIDRKKITGKKIIWIQAISVGEIATAAPVVAEMKRSLPDFDYVISVTTEAGFERAKKTFPDALKIFFTPFDFYPSIANLIKKIRPQAILVIETGFWPNLISIGKKMGAALILINGRISERSFKNYKVIAPVAGYVLNLFDVLITRDRNVSERFKELGINEKKIFSFGDVKYDTLPTTGSGEKERYQKIFSIHPDERVIMAGNTHEGEEEYMLDIFGELKNRFKNILLIIAPRRLERIPQIEKTLRDKGWSYVKRTALTSENTRADDVILLNTIGELSMIYFLCDIIFVGKSIFPPGGGHSLLEPVAAGKIAFHGTYVQYYEEARDLLQKEGLSIELKGRSAFIECFSRIFLSRDKNREFEKKAGEFLSKKKGASKKVMEVVMREINRQSPPPLL